MFKCQMPECTYMCEDKSQINFHHIVPRSMGGSDKAFNLIELCPNCHARIYVEGIASGQHSVKNKNSVVLLSKMLSTSGLVISYKNVDDVEVKYCLLK